MTLTACILKPRGPFHVGDQEGMREGSNVFIHSDTLFSALCHSFRLLHGKTGLEQFLDSFPGVGAASLPPVRLSSAFPFWEEEFWLPVPHNQFPPPGKKDAKKVRFLPRGIFEKALSGSLADDDWLQGIPLPQPATKKTGGLSKPWLSEDVPRVTVPRLTCHQTEESGAFYHLGQTWFREGALFFLLDVAEEWKHSVDAAIRLMCDEGIGGYRSVGKGQFEQPQLREFTLQVPESATCQLMLSLYYPASGEETGLADGWYDLLMRRGYVFSPETRSLRRKQVLIFGEGSVFPGKNRMGRLVDVTPDSAEQLGLSHRVWRNGLAFAVPCRLPGKCEAVSVERRTEQEEE